MLGPPGGKRQRVARRDPKGLDGSRGVLNRE